MQIEIRQRNGVLGALCTEDLAARATVVLSPEETEQQFAVGAGQAVLVVDPHDHIVLEKRGL